MGLGIDRLAIDEIGLGERDDAPIHFQQIEDRQMLAGLGHDAFVGGDDQKGHVDTAHAGPQSALPSTKRSRLVG